MTIDWLYIFAVMIQQEMDNTDLNPEITSIFLQFHLVHLLHEKEFYNTVI